MPSGSFAARALKRARCRIFQALEYCQGFVDGLVHQAHGGLQADHSTEKRHIENLLLDELQRVLRLDARQCFERADFLRLAPFFKNALNVWVEEPARQRDFFLAGQEGWQRFAHQPGRLVHSVEHERRVC
jgi:hypothetical protein